MNSYVFAGEMKGCYNDARRALVNAKCMFDMVAELQDSNRRWPRAWDDASILSYFQMGLDYLAMAESARKRAREYRGHMLDARRWEESCRATDRMRKENEAERARQIAAGILIVRGA